MQLRLRCFLQRGNQVSAPASAVAPLVLVVAAALGKAPPAVAIIRHSRGHLCKLLLPTMHLSCLSQDLLLVSYDSREDGSCVMHEICCTYALYPGSSGCKHQAHNSISTFISTCLICILPMMSWVLQGSYALWVMSSSETYNSMLTCQTHHWQYTCICNIEYDCANQLQFANMQSAAHLLWRFC